MPNLISPVDVLVLDVLPFQASTRSRKASMAYRQAEMKVAYFSLATAGRRSLAGKQSGWQSASGIQIYAAPVPGFRPGTGSAQVARNLISYLFGFACLFVVTLRAKRLRAVHVANPILLPLAMFVKACRRSTVVVFDGRERPGRIAMKRSLTGIASAAFPLLFRGASRFVDVLLVVSPSHLAEYSRLGFQCIHVVLNGPEGQPSLDRPKESQSTLRVGYVGSLYPGRGLEQAVMAVGEMRSERPDIELHVFGGGEPGYLRQVSELALSVGGHEFIFFHGPFEPECVSEIYRTIDVGLILYDPREITNDSLPNKLFDCMAAGCPAVANMPSAADIVLSERCGLVADSSLPGLRAALAHFMQLDAHERFEMGKRGWAAIHERYSWTRQFNPVVSELRRLGV